MDESSDTYDTIEFLLKHVPNNNGKVGIWGISYPGFYTSASIIDSHPALVAASPQAPMTDLFLGDDAYHGGAFMLSANFGFYAPFFHAQQNPTASGPTVRLRLRHAGQLQVLSSRPATSRTSTSFMKGPNWLCNDQFKHDTYDDYWQARDLSRHMKNVKCAVLVVGGWYDAEDLEGPYRTFYAINKFNPDTPTTLVEGPWVHGGWARSDGDHLGDVQFNAKTADYFRANIQFPFFEHYLKGGGKRCPRRSCLKPEPMCGAATTRGRPRPPRQRRSTFTPAANSASIRRPKSKERRRVPERSQPPGALRGLHHRYRAAALHGRRPALRQLRGPTC